MKKREYLDYVQDILDSVNAIEDFVQGLTYDDFKKDRKTIFATIRGIEIIGEATKRVSVAVRNKHPEIPWKDMAGMRDKLAHDYLGVDVHLLWTTIQSDLPHLKAVITRLLQEGKG